MTFQCPHCLRWHEAADPAVHIDMCGRFAAVFARAVEQLLADLEETPS